MRSATVEPVTRLGPAPRRAHAIVALVAVLALVVAACGSSDDKKADAPAQAETAASADGHDEHAHHAADDGGLGMLRNGHHEAMQYAPLSAEDQAALDPILAASRTVSERYPTLGDAIDAGFTRSGPYAPGLGIHYSAPWIAQALNPDGTMSEDDATHPMIVIFDGTERSAKVAGFMYYSVAGDQPQGFPGGNDTWHYHTNTCIVRTADGINAPLGADTDVDPARCAELGGATMAKTQWMVHVWSVPGYAVDEANGGVFAEVNPKLTCADGSYHMVGVDEMPNRPYNVCQSV